MLSLALQALVCRPALASHVVLAEAIKTSTTGPENLLPCSRGSYRATVSGIMRLFTITTRHTT